MLCAKYRLEKTFVTSKIKQVSFLGSVSWVLIYQDTVHDTTKLGLHALCYLSGMQIVCGVNPSSCRGGAEYSTHTVNLYFVQDTFPSLTPHT